MSVSSAIPSSSTCPPTSGIWTRATRGACPCRPRTRSLARPDYAEVTGQDEKGNPVKVRGTGYFARCLQHETDHLYGYLYIDRLSKRDRKDALRQMAENEPRYPVVAND